MNKLKMLFQPVDMTIGVPWKDIAIFTFPMLLGNIAQQLYNTVDSVVVGHYLGDNALAAVGSANPIMNLLIVLFVAIATGASIMVAQYCGAKSRTDLANAIGNGIMLSLIAVLLIMVVATIIIKPLLVLLNTPEEILPLLATYLRIIFIGIAGMAYYNILSGMLRGLGDSVTPLIYLILASALNIILDLVFVAKLGMGVDGVAIATCIAQAISALCCLRKLCQKSEYFTLSKASFHLQKKYIFTLGKLGIPSAINQGALSLAMLLVQSLTNSFGATLVAANVIIMRVDAFAMLPNFSYGNATTTFAGQNVGAKQYDRVSQGAKQGTILAIGTSAVITALILLFGKSLMSIFTTTTSLVDLAYHLMCIIAPGYMFLAVTQSLAGIMRGAGDATTPMWLSIITLVVIRVPSAYLIAYLTRSAENPIGIQESPWISLIICWIFGAIITALFYFRGNWKKKAIRQ